MSWYLQTDVITFVMTCGGVLVVELKVRKFGNSLGVVLPKQVISRLKAKEGARLYLSEGPDGGYRLTPFDPNLWEKDGGG